MKSEKAAEPAFPIYDADNHFYEPPEAFLRHLPARYRKDFQYVVVNGRTKLAINNVISDYIPNPTFEVVAAPGVHEDWYRYRNADGLTLREMTGEPIASPPAFQDDREARLALMDSQNVRTIVLFPTLASVIEGRMDYDHEVMYAVIHSLNQWIEETWGFGRDGRIFAAPVVTLMDVESAVNEVEWLLKRDVQVVLIRPAPVSGYRFKRSFALPEFDPVWSRLSEAGVKVAMHACDSGYDLITRWWEGSGYEYRPFEPTPFKQVVGTQGRNVFDAMASAVCHGLFERHPSLRVLSVENGAHWVKPLLTKFDLVYRQMPKSFKEHPAEVFKNHVFIAPYYEDPIEELVGLIGADRILFGSDFPHPEGLAEPRSFIGEMDGLSAAEQEKIMNGNLKGLLEAA